MIRHARNAARAFAFALVFSLTFAAWQTPAAAPADAKPGPTVHIDGHDAHGFAALSSSVLGWHWQGTVNVYDATDDARWKVAEAAREWTARTGLQTQMVGSVAAAQVVVYEVENFTDPNYPNAIGLTYWPQVVGATADGQCRIELLTWVAEWYPVTAEHDALHELGHCLSLAHNTTDKRSVMAPTVQLGEGYSRPTAADLRNLQSVYGR